MRPELQTRLDQTVGLYQRGDAEQAERLCLEILREKPGDPKVLHLLGIIRAKLGRFAEALENYDEALRVNPDFMLLYNRGITLRQLKRFDEARIGFENALALNPNSAEAWNGRGNCLRDLGRPAEALASFDKALSLKPAAPEILYNRGTALFDLKRYDEALAAFDMALAIKPDVAEILINRGMALGNLNRSEEALANFDKAIALEPGNIKALNNRGATLHDLKRFAEARAHYESALVIAPDNPELMNNLAKVLCETGRTPESFGLFRRSARIAGTPIPDDKELPHKVRHDQEQQAHLSTIDAPETGARLSGPAIRPDNHVDDITRQWQTKKPQVIVIDDLLTDEALEKLRRFCHDTPMWHTVYGDGYLGAGPEQGFATPLLAQIADELHSTFPAIFRDHALHYLWAFKYDSALRGINIHADEAAVNVNFWITPDEANLNPEHGGLVVWDVAAPLDWDFAKFNNDHVAIRAFLTEKGATAITIPYRVNRAVIFDSDLFHETDTIKFKDGYLNRRINVTLLYGRREWAGTS